MALFDLNLHEQQETQIWIHSLTIELANYTELKCREYEFDFMKAYPSESHHRYEWHLVGLYFNERETNISTRATRITDQDRSDYSIQISDSDVEF
jgi:hypothetical protein